MLFLKSLSSPQFRLSVSFVYEFLFYIAKLFHFFLSSLLRFHESFFRLLSFSCASWENVISWEKKQLHKKFPSKNTLFHRSFSRAYLIIKFIQQNFVGIRLQLGNLFWCRLICQAKVFWGQVRMKCVWFEIQGGTFWFQILQWSRSSMNH